MLYVVGSSELGWSQQPYVVCGREPRARLEPAALRFVWLEALS